MDPGSTLLVELTYTVPLFLVAGTLILLAWWSRSRAAPLPARTPSPPRGYGIDPADKIAYSSLAEGRYLPAIDLLGRRLALVVERRYHVHLDRTHGFYPEAIRLPPPLKLGDVLDHLLSAYRAAARAETTSWLNEQWTWLRRRRQQRAADEFTYVLAEVAAALPALEAG